MDPVLNVPELLIYYPSTLLYGRKCLLMEVILHLSIIVEKAAPSTSQPVVCVNLEIISCHICR